MKKSHASSGRGWRFFSLLVLLSISLARVQAEALQKGDVVAICGDSITEQKLYSVFLEDYFLMCQPVPDLQAHQFGWRGESVGGLVNRINRSVLPFQPSVATTCYGMNDGGYSPIDMNRQQKFREGTESMVKIFKEAGLRLIVVGSPGIVDTDTFDKKADKKYPAQNYNNETLADLARIAKEVATSQGVLFADIHTPFTKVMAQAKIKYGPTYHVAGSDGIHPAANGHLIMAYAFLQALGCTGDIGTITVDLSHQQATATEGHKVLSLTNGVVELVSTRYPFCFPGKAEDPESARGILEFLPFHEDLNRYRLIVKNASAPAYKITWGAESKTFSSAALARGINLAAEFLDNPFLEAFVSVEKAIRDQQTFETPATKNILHTLPGWEDLLPGEKAALDQLRDAVLRRSRKLTETACASVHPVQHKILIEPAS